MPKGKAAKDTTEQPTGAAAAELAGQPEPERNPLDQWLIDARKRMPNLPVYCGTAILNAEDPRLTHKQLQPLIRILRQELQNIATTGSPSGG